MDFVICFVKCIHEPLHTTLYNKIFHWQFDQISLNKICAAFKNSNVSIIMFTIY